MRKNIENEKQQHIEGAFASKDNLRLIDNTAGKNRTIEEKNQQEKLRLTKKLAALFEKFQPEVITPSWIEEKYKSLYINIIKATIKGIFTGWPDILGQLDDKKWLDRWKRLREPQRKKKGAPKTVWAWPHAAPTSPQPARGVVVEAPGRIGDITNGWESTSDEPQTFEENLLGSATEDQQRKADLLTRLNDLLSKHKPDKFSPMWIKRTSYYLYKDILDGIKDGILSGWNDIVTNLDAERLAISKWQGRTFDLEKKPIIPYEDEAEADTALEPYKDLLYLFLSAKSWEEWHACDDMCMALLHLVRNGNIAAQKKLHYFLSPVVSTWAEKYQILTPITQFPDRVAEIMDHCFKFYNFKKADSFTSYLFTTLRFKALDIKHEPLDQPIDDEGGSTLSEILPDLTNDNADLDQMPDNED